MEQQMDTLKVYKHVQHARLQNEDDMWISSEDLRTEGSSDEDTSLKSHRPKRNKKLKQTESRLNTSKDIFSLTPNVTELFDLPTKDTSSSSAKLISQVERTLLEKTTERCQESSGRFLPDIFLDSAPSTSGISLGSTDADMDALNLESRWRPKRGSLKYPILVDGQTTENYIEEVKGLYNNMMCKLKLLRNCPAMTRVSSQNDATSVKAVESRLLKDLKHTPEVKEKLKYIQQLDDEIKETIQTYKAERSERLQAQDEMCSEIYKNKSFPPRDAQMFLEMCHFEASEDKDKDEIEDSHFTEENEVNNVKRQRKNTDFANNFIKRNIELAKEGAMAGCSLTDEEKRSLADLLTDVECLDEDDVAVATRVDTDFDFIVEEDEDSDSETCISNAYMMSEAEKNRIDDIDSELEKFKLDETDKEKIYGNSLIFRQREWKDVILEHRLKNIDSQLTQLYKNYEKEDNTLAEDVSPEDENADAAVDSDANDSACVSDCSEAENS